MLIAYEEPGTVSIRAPVLKVFDGDGFKTLLWNTQLQKPCEVVVRLGFTDAPELEQPGGQESKAFLTSLIADRWVELVVLLKMDTGRILARVFEGQLPPVNGPEYMQSWGDRGTPKRLQKMAESIAAAVKSAKRRSADYSVAIEHWEEDLAHLHATYYLGRFGFGWPAL